MGEKADRGSVARSSRREATRNAKKATRRGPTNAFPLRTLRRVGGNANDRGRTYECKYKQIAAGRQAAGEKGGEGSRTIAPV